ncbi:MAG: hypothetical protein FWF73_03005 [Spirochaetes bacterium]|nr:hypothetical protein [Spirochaetota bacterium]
MLNLKRLKDFFTRKKKEHSITEELKQIMPDEDYKSSEESVSSEKDVPAEKKKSFGKNKKEKKLKRKDRPLSRRILIQFAKTLFIRIPIAVVILVIVILIFLKFYLRPSVVESLIKNNFSEMSTGSIDLKVESFGIYKGFVINNILIKSGEDFGNAKLFEMERFVFSYDFFKIFTGSIKFYEIGIYKPKVYLIQKNDKWNVETLIKSSEKEDKPKDEKKPKEEKKESSSDEVNLPIAVDFLLNFILDDLSVYVNGKDFTAEMTGLSFNANIDVPPVKTIPKSVDAVRIFKTLKFELNPQNFMSAKFYSKAISAVPELVLNWKLILKNDETPEFNSTLNIGANRLPLKLNDKFLAPFNFLISYDIFYNPISDILKINDFNFSFMNSNWIKLSGTVSDVAKSQMLNIKMDQSIIPLKDIYPYYAAITGDRSMRFGGDVSLFPLTVKGGAKSPNIDGILTLKNIYFRNPNIEASLPQFVFKYSVIAAGENMNFNGDLNIPHFAYVVQGSKSGDNGIRFTTSILGYNNFKRIKINSVAFDFFNPEAGKAVSMNLFGDINMDGSVTGDINIPKFRIDVTPLASMVPGRFRKQISSIPIKKPVDFNISTNFNLGNDVVKANLDMLTIAPDYNIDDLKLKAGVVQDNRNKRVTIDNIYFGSKKMNFAFNAGGMVELKKAPFSDSNLRMSLELNNPSMKNIFGAWDSSGMVKLSASMKGDLSTGVSNGSLQFKDFNIRNDKEMVSVSGLNMDFPFEYPFKELKIIKSALSVNQSVVMDSDRFSEKPNFTITSVKAKHPARNIPYEYMKDFSANMQFKDNILNIKNLKASVMGGSIYGRSILLNLANLKPSKMEFQIILDVVDIDISRLDDPTSKKGDKKADLSLNANVSGRGLDINKELNATGYITISKIGSEFASRLMKGLSEEQGKSKLGAPVQYVVDKSMPKSFDFRLDNGLVYTTVEFSKNALNLLVRIEDNKIEYDRIPIQEYLRKVSEAE